MSGTGGSACAGAKAILEADGFKIDTFAYPYSAYNRRIVDLVEAAGFRIAGLRATADGPATLPGMTFQTFGRSYANRVTLKSGASLR